MAKSTKKDAEIAMDRRTKTTDRRAKGDRREKQEAVAEERRAAPRRQKVQRRRQIDPTTCERDYTNDEIEFMQAMDEYKRRSGRMFPTCSEILEVIRDIGYSKQNSPVQNISESLQPMGEDANGEPSEFNLPADEEALEFIEE